MILLCVLAAAASKSRLESVVRYVFPLWEMNLYDSGIVTAKNNLTELNSRLVFHSEMQRINLGHTIASSVGTLCMAAVACVAAPIPGTIGAVSFGIYSAYHALLKGLSATELTQTQFRIKELKGEAKLKGKYVHVVYSMIPDIFYSSDLLGWALVFAVAWGIYLAKVHQIKEWKELRRVIGLLIVVLIALVCIGFLQTIHNVERQQIERREWLEAEINHRCNILKMNYIRRIWHEVKSFMGATIDSDQYVHNAECDALTEEYRLIRGDLITIACKCVVRVFHGAVVEELFGKMSFTTKLLLLAALAILACMVVAKTLAAHVGDIGTIGPALRVAAIGIIILLFLRILSII